MLTGAVIHRGSGGSLVVGKMTVFSSPGVKPERCPSRPLGQAGVGGRCTALCQALVSAGVCCGMGGGLLGALCSSQQGRRSSQLCKGHPECREV